MSSSTMDDEDSVMGTKSPIKRLGSTRKLLFFNNIRLHLSEQLRCLDVRMEAQVALVAELQDYFRRRAELELDYSKNLDKLAKSLQLRHKEQKQKREHWPLFSSYSCWQQLVTQTKNLSKDHAALSEVHSTHLVSRLGQVMEDVQRIYKKCREIGYETHEDILRVLQELHTTMKTYHAYQAEFRQAENKLRVAENQRLKQESTLPREKLDRSKKYRLIEKEVQKRKNKYNDAKLKALKARNEYVLCLEASNTTIHKYFVDDLSDLIDCMDFGFHNCISRALLMHISAEEGLERSVQAGLDNLHNCIGSLDSRLDKQRFLESNHTAFTIPKKFEFQGLRGDDGPEPDLQKGLKEELEARLTQLQQRITSLRTESEEVWKTLETAETTLLEMLNAKDYDCSEYFGENSVPTNKPPETVSIKLRADRQETEEFYLSKFREYVLGTSRIARLDAKSEHIRQTLLNACGDSPNWFSGAQNHVGNNQGSLPQAKPPRRKRIGRQMNGQPKLFGGSLEEYLEASNQEIPLIVKSCIRVINLYGLHHQGIFRVSGSQVEINNFREAFERGEDPLADVTDASDINSVAGVLKLYLRELREPLFPIIYFEQFMELAQEESKHGFVAKIRDLVQSLPKPVIIVMKYLFAFLNHLSEFSDENMMDPYNLAICFGPTLVPVPEEKDQVQYQNLVNELIKNIILYNEEIFPVDVGTVLYEKYISKEPDECDVGDSPSDQIQEDLDSEVYPSEDESDLLEATAQFDFIARSDRELSLKKGDHVTLYTQVSNDWWRGSVNGQEGLIPDKYILLKIKDEDRDKADILKSSSSEESMRRRASSSNDSVLSSGTSSSTHNSPLISVSPMAWPGETEQRTDWIQRNNKNEESVSLLTTTHEENTSENLKLSNQKEKESKTESSAVTLLPGVGKSQTLDKAAHRKDEGEQERVNGVDLEIVKTKDSYTRRKTHWKSQSVGEYTKESATNFNQNRELWQRRAASQGQIDPPIAPRTTQELWDLRQKQTPDLVMDLPFVGSPKDGLDKAIAEEETGAELSSPGPESPDMTAAERFAKQNQCTLKKNTKGNLPRSKANSEVFDEKTSSEVESLGNFLNSDKIIQVKSELELVINPEAHQQRLTPKLPVKFAAVAAPPIPSIKPQIKQKPQILRKPVLPLPVPPTQVAPELSQKDAPN